MTHEQVWLYLMIVPPGACIIAALLGRWATNRSLKRLQRRIGEGQR